MRQTLSAILLVSLLTGCANLSFNSPSICPEYPIAGPKVADELAAVCLPEDKCPNTWHWLAELKIHKTKIDICRSKE